MILIKGKPIAEKIDNITKQRIDMLGWKPSICILLANDTEPSRIYTELKKRRALELGINCEIIKFESNCSKTDLIEKLNSLQAEKQCNGVMVQLPLFDHLEPARAEILNTIKTDKDIDGLSEKTLGRIFSNKNSILPATAQAVLECLRDVGEHEFKGKEITIINNSNLIGLPLSIYFSKVGATVRIANEFTKDIESHISQSDIVITATGQTELFSSKRLKEGSLAIDITSIHKNGKIIGDIFWEENIEQRNITITQVPGGIGPVTVSCIFQNLVKLLNL